MLDFSRHENFHFEQLKDYLVVHIKIFWIFCYISMNTASSKLHNITANCLYMKTYRHIVKSFISFVEAILCRKT
jgi:hypothetical protein